MNKATFERAMKAVATGKPLKEIKVITEDGLVHDVDKVEFDPANDCIYIKVIEEEEN